MQVWYRLFAVSACYDIHVATAGLLTFGEKSSVAIVQVPAQEPAVTKVIVALYELYAVSLGQTQLISTACYEVVHDQQYRAGGRIDLASQNRGHGGFGVGLVFVVCAQAVSGAAVFTSPLSPSAR